MNFDFATDHTFLIVKKLDVLYREFASRPKFNTPIYALPLHGIDANRLAIRYSGLDRNPLRAYDKTPALAAEMRMYELEQSGRCSDAYTFAEANLSDVFAWAEAECPGMYEPIWARVCGSTAPPPDGSFRLGCEPSYFPGGYFSTICDCMCLPRWHGTDLEGVVFLPFFRQLNACGLFESSTIAESFLAHYLSFDWTERGEYSIAEVWQVCPGR